MGPDFWSEQVLVFALARFSGTHLATHCTLPCFPHHIHSLIPKPGKLHAETGLPLEPSCLSLLSLTDDASLAYLSAQRAHNPGAQVSPPHSSPTPNTVTCTPRHRVQARMVTTGARTGLQQQQQQQQQLKRQRVPSLKAGGAVDEDEDVREDAHHLAPAQTASKAAVTGKRKGSTNRFHSSYRGK